MTKVNLGQKILGANDLLARRNRMMFKEHELLVLNLMSSPGAGKTTLLEQTISQLKGRLEIGVIEGDLFTDNDARRIEQLGAPVVQINTKGACHLDAEMVNQAFGQLIGDRMDLLVIENVGNLVCPAEFDLGEDLRVVVMSVTEGNDKLVKYPLVFHQADSVLINKMDLLPYTDFDLTRVCEDIRQFNPSAVLFPVSARSGEGLATWCQWLEEKVQGKKFDEPG